MRLTAVTDLYKFNNGCIYNKLPPSYIFWLSVYQVEKYDIDLGCTRKRVTLLLNHHRKGLVPNATFPVRAAFIKVYTSLKKKSNEPENAR